MTDSALLNQAGSILLYVAPGFFARLSYRTRFPHREPGDLYALVVSVAASVPVVALGHLIAKKLNVGTAPTSVDYVAILLGLAVLGGYVVAMLRDWSWTRRGFQRIGLPYGPEATVMERTVFKLREGEVTVTLKDGRVVSGDADAGTGHAEEGEPRELFLSWPRWWLSEDGRWDDAGTAKGLLINLDEVAFIELPENPLLATSRPSSGPDTRS